MTQEELLDSEELIHLALQATNRLDSGTAIEYLKRLLSLDPEHPEALYLLGAQEAQIGLFSRALEHMSRAVTLRPGMEIARFQLGWLQMNSGDTPSAEQTWLPLDALGEEHPFVLFKKGLLHLGRGETAQSLRCLEQGIAANTMNAPLNTDMATLVEHVRRRVHEEMPDAAPREPDADADVPAMYLDAYTGKKT
jgi:tetratricopeptide (TPR) repeat protein